MENTPMFIMDCRDHGCGYTNNKSGQRTNGGCRCLGVIAGPLRHKLLIREAQRVSLIGVIRQTKEALEENVFECGQPGTWATALHDRLSELFHQIEISTGLPHLPNTTGPPITGPIEGDSK